MNPERWQQIERIYNRVLELDPSRRAAFIKGACADDEPLRKEVERLLARQSEAEHFIESPAIEMAAQALANDQDPDIDRDLTGRTLLHYRIEEKIGEGGMGVVYRAHDTRLGRDVAIKVLPESFARERERLARFAREARLLATLNHPNVASVYGLEEAEGRSCLVLELVEGKTLAERLKKGRLRLDEALVICRQIAEGLEAAHEKGVIHRDLKPGNVMITADDQVKILDFGLAKTVPSESQAAEATHSPTITEAMTRPEVILGTASYLSPEQARGKTVDKRADIWAFGCVLYECLTGKRAFPGETITESIAKILESEPDWEGLPSTTPGIIRLLLRLCLQKDPSRRLRDIGDARIEIGESVSQPSEAVALPRRLSGRVLLAGIALTLVAGALIGAVFIWNFRSAPSAPVTRSIIRIEPGFWLDGIRWPTALQRPTRTAMAISRDGHFIVYSAIAENPGPTARPRLYLRRTDQIEARPISGTEGGISPFLSPDDRWVGWWAPGEDSWNGRLMKVSINGGVPLTLCNMSMPLGVSWGTDNSIVLAHISGRGLYRVAGDGGNPESLTMPDRSRGEYSHRLPHHLPDGRHVLFTTMKGSADLHPRVAILDLATRDYRVLLEDAADARYAVTGHLIFMRQGTLMAVGFDTRSLKVIGRPAPVIDNVMQALNTGSIARDTRAGQFSVSDSGSLAYATGGIVPDPENSLVWVEHEGMDQTILPFKAGFSGPRLSPDGGHILYSSQGRVWVYDIERSTATPVTDEGTGDAIWTPNGQRIVFNCGESSNLCWQPVDGSAPMERLTTSDATQWPGSWTPDGETLSFSEMDPDTADENILLLRVRDRKVTPFLHSRFAESAPEFSPDGRWLAYVSDESGRSEVYVRPFPGPGGRFQVSNEGGAQPLWARDGRRLFYLTQDRVWVVDVAADMRFRWSKPRLLLHKPGYTVEFPFRSWDLSLDEKRLLIVKLGDVKPQPITEMILVQNWFEELKRLAPTK